MRKTKTLEERNILQKTKKKKLPPNEMLALQCKYSSRQQKVFEMATKNKVKVKVSAFVCTNPYVAYM